MFTCINQLIPQKNCKIIYFNVNKHTPEYFKSYCPLFYYFKKNHSVSFLKSYKFNKYFLVKSNKMKKIDY